MRGIIHHSALCLSGLAAALTGCMGPSAAVKPNIVIILADDMGWGDLGINGNNYVSTPALNRLKNESLSFDRFYVCPLSAPTRAEMLTGRYFLRTGVSSVTRGYENMRTGEITIAEVLKDNGYSTGCFGKWHNGGYFQQHPNRQGFDEFTGFCVGHLGYYFDGPFLHNDESVMSSGYTSDFFTDKALEFIEQNSRKPFLCYVAYNVPHSPFMVPEEYFSKYCKMDLDSTLSAVYGMVENMDKNIDRILDRLTDLGLRKNTIVVFFSDNGPNTARYNGNMKGIKGSVDEGGMRVPFYISWPGHIKNGSTAQLAQDIDIMPTLLGLCRINYRQKNRLDGSDLSGLAEGRKDAFSRMIFSRQANQSLELCNSSVRNDKYRLVLTRRDTLLYDMDADPGQKVNISEKETEITSLLLSELVDLNTELVSGYIPVTTIEAGFPTEKSFILPVQDADLSGMIRFSSIHPNQSYTQNWVHNGDSLYWKLKIVNTGRYRAEMQYGCSESETGSDMLLFAGSEKKPFSISKSFDSRILPDRDYVKRSESVERTWSWMEIGDVFLNSGEQNIGLKLIQKKNNEAGYIKSVRFTRIQE